jgi:glycosyltransferase involved in cell wall biosynthesis
MIVGLRALGWVVRIHTLHESSHCPIPRALAHTERVLAGLPEGSCVLIDGLALEAIPELIEAHSRRITIVALLHMPQEPRALQCVRHVIVTGRDTQRVLESRGVNPSRVSVVEPGVGTVESGVPDRVEGGIVELLCVATIHEGKGHELLIDALAPLAHLPWRLRCLGSLSRSPTTVRRLTERVQQLGLTRRVALLGEIPHADLGAFYLSADLFVLPTLRESYGMAVAESLAHGLPVISSRTGAIPDLVGSTAGLLVAPGDGKALHLALARVLENAALRASLRAGALAARNRLTPWPQACQRMAQVLGQVCQAAEAVSARRSQSNRMSRPAR